VGTLNRPTLLGAKFEIVDVSSGIQTVFVDTETPVQNLNLSVTPYLYYQGPAVIHIKISDRGDPSDCVQDPSRSGPPT